MGTSNKKTYFVAICFIVLIGVVATLGVILAQGDGKETNVNSPDIAPTTETPSTPKTETPNPEDAIDETIPVITAKEFMEEILNVAYTQLELDLKGKVYQVSGTVKLYGSEPIEPTSQYPCFILGEIRGVILHIWLKPSEIEKAVRLRDEDKVVVRGEYGSFNMLFKEIKLEECVIVQ